VISLIHLVAAKLHKDSASHRINAITHVFVNALPKQASVLDVGEGRCEASLWHRRSFLYCPEIFDY